MNIEVTTWIIWVGAGLAVAFVAAGLLGGRKMLGYDLFVGIAGSILGGFCSACIAGDSTVSELIMSVMFSVFLSILGVYLLNRLVVRHTHGR